MQEQETEVRVLAESTLVVPDSAALRLRRRALGAGARRHAAGLEGGAAVRRHRHRVVDRPAGPRRERHSPIGFRMERTRVRDGGRELAAQRATPRAAARRSRRRRRHRRHGHRRQRAASRPATLTRAAGRAAATSRCDGLRPLGRPAAAARATRWSVRRETGVGRRRRRRQLPRLYLTGCRSRDTALARRAGRASRWCSPTIRASRRRRARSSGRERRAGPVAELLTRWVYDNLEKKITISVPSAAAGARGPARRLQRAHRAVRGAGARRWACRRAPRRAWCTCAGTSTTTPGRRSGSASGWRWTRRSASSLPTRRTCASSSAAWPARSSWCA